MPRTGGAARGDERGGVDRVELRLSGHGSPCDARKDWGVPGSGRSFHIHGEHRGDEGRVGSSYDSGRGRGVSLLREELLPRATTGRIPTSVGECEHGRRAWVHGRRGEHHVHRDLQSLDLRGSEPGRADHGKPDQGVEHDRGLSRSECRRGRGVQLDRAESARCRALPEHPADRTGRPSEGESHPGRGAGELGRARLGRAEAQARPAVGDHGDNQLRTNNQKPFIYENQKGSHPDLNAEQNHWFIGGVEQSSPSQVDVVPYIDTELPPAQPPAPPNDPLVDVDPLLVYPGGEQGCWPPPAPGDTLPSGALAGLSAGSGPEGHGPGGADAGAGLSREELPSRRQRKSHSVPLAL
jgi:hypothetical protein